MVLLPLIMTLISHPTLIPAFLKYGGKIEHQFVTSFSPLFYMTKRKGRGKCFNDLFIQRRFFAKLVTSSSQTTISQLIP